MSNEKTLELASQARSLFESQNQGSLATLSAKHDGHPFCSLMPYALDAAGRPIFLMSAMAVHSKNLRGDVRATLLVTDGDGELAKGRGSLVGTVESVPENEINDVRQTYINIHPEARQWAGFGDFQFVRMQLIDIYFIGGFGAMGWVDVDSYSKAFELS